MFFGNVGSISEAYTALYLSPTESFTPCQEKAMCGDREHLLMLVLIYGVFSFAGSSSDYVVSNYRMNNV
jgi:hypothetical protein